PGLLRKSRPLQCQSQDQEPCLQAAVLQVSRRVQSRGQNAGRSPFHIHQPSGPRREAAKQILRRDCRAWRSPVTDDKRHQGLSVTSRPPERRLALVRSPLSLRPFRNYSILLGAVGLPERGGGSHFNLRSSSSLKKHSPIELEPAGAPGSLRGS